MNEMVQIRSVKQYFNEFIAEPLENAKNITAKDILPAKQKILKAFKDEVFGQIYFKLGDKAKDMTRDELADLEPVHNILHQSFRKWRRFCMVCSERGLGGLFGLEDLRDALTEEEDEIEPDPEEIVDDSDFEKDTYDNYIGEELKAAEPEVDGYSTVLPPEEEDVTDHIHDAGVLPFGEEPVYLNGGVNIEEASDELHQTESL